MTSVNLKIPAAFEFLWTPSRYKGAWGGRGSAKSHSFATALVTQGAQGTNRPERILCCREVQDSIEDSVKQLLDDKIKKAGLQHFYTSTKTEIRGPESWPTRFMFAGLRNETVDSIKSKEGLTKAWIEEAQNASKRSLEILIPTIRADDSEIWASWNPESEHDAIDQLLRGKNVPKDAIVRRVSWRDNPFFPAVLKAEMERQLAADAEAYDHIWEGGYRQAPKGAYYAGLLAEAKAAGRLGNVPHDPKLDVHVAFDLGVGKNMALTLSQWLGREVRIIDCLEGDEEAAIEGLPWYVRKLREKKRYTYAPLILPHDARHGNVIVGKGAEETLRGFGFDTVVVPKMKPEERVELVKRFLPTVYIDETNCAPALRAWKEYRENWDDKLRISRGPLHDWTSHFADSLGHLAQAYDLPDAGDDDDDGDPQGEGGWMN